MSIKNGYKKNKKEEEKTLKIIWISKIYVGTGFEHYS